MSYCDAPRLNTVVRHIERDGYRLFPLSLEVWTTREYVHATEVSTSLLGRGSVGFAWSTGGVCGYAPGANPWTPGTEGVSMFAHGVHTLS